MSEPSFRAVVGAVVSALELSSVLTVQPNSSPRTARTVQPGSPSSHSPRPLSQAILLLPKARSNIGRSNRAATADGAQLSPRPQSRPPSRHTSEEPEARGALRRSPARPPRHSDERGARGASNELALRTNSRGRPLGRPLLHTPPLHAVPHTASSPRSGLQTSEQRRGRDPAGGDCVISAEIKGCGAEMLRWLEMGRDGPDGAGMLRGAPGVPAAAAPSSARRTAFAPPRRPSAERTRTRIPASIARDEPEPDAHQALATGMGAGAAPVRPATVVHGASRLFPHAELALHEARRGRSSSSPRPSTVHTVHTVPTVHSVHSALSLTLNDNAFRATPSTAVPRSTTTRRASRSPTRPSESEWQSPEGYEAAAAAAAGRSSHVDVTSYRRQYLETKALGRPITPYGIGAHWGGCFE